MAGNNNGNRGKDIWSRQSPNTWRLRQAAAVCGSPGLGADRPHATGCAVGVWARVACYARSCCISTYYHKQVSICARLVAVLVPSWGGGRSGRALSQGVWVRANDTHEMRHQPYSKSVAYGPGPANIFTAPRGVVL